MLTELSSHRHVLALSVADTRAGRCRLPPPCRWSGRGTGAWPRSRPAVLSRPALRESFRPRHCVTVTSRKITVRCWNPDTGFEAARCRSLTSPQGPSRCPVLATPTVPPPPAGQPLLCSPFRSFCRFKRVMCANGKPLHVTLWDWEFSLSRVSAGMPPGWHDGEAPRGVAPHSPCERPPREDGWPRDGGFLSRLSRFLCARLHVSGMNARRAACWARRPSVLAFIRSRQPVAPSAHVTLHAPRRARATRFSWLHVIRVGAVTAVYSSHLVRRALMRPGPPLRPSRAHGC